MINRVILSGNHAGMFHNDNDNEAQITPVVVQVMWSVLFSFLEPLRPFLTDWSHAWSGLLSRCCHRRHLES